MKHIDLFSGIGGFALAADTVFGEVEHVFCDIDPFAQRVIKKHWPTSKIYGDIRTLTPDTHKQRHVHRKPEIQPAVGDDQALGEPLAGFDSPFILTGGFPCQPFSQAGRRKGTEDNRHLWPEMLRVIESFKPKWVIAENVRGLLTIGGGVVFEQVCLDLESAGYEVQPIVIPAVAVDAPHRRDRVWFVAHREGRGRNERSGNNSAAHAKRMVGHEKERDTLRSQSAGRDTQHNIADPQGKQAYATKSKGFYPKSSVSGWRRDWIEVAAELCRVDDGIPKRLDRNQRLKALGNAIVPQVAMQIMKAIKENSLCK
jgi:DNA (cytosine-5)-methyltransferase 1